MATSAGARRLLEIVRPPVETQAGIARKLGVTPQAVQKWLCGFSRPEREHREKLEQLVGIPAASWDEIEAEPKRKRSRGKAAA
jgi:transcriptional regulator with XRE-family HTH domain